MDSGRASGDAGGRVTGLYAAADELRRAAVERDPWLAGLRLVGIGWATVELERAAEEVSIAARRAGLGEPDWALGERDVLLGAMAWLGGVAWASGAAAAASQPTAVVLLEPDTEGRLAAALARFDEGVAAIYLAPEAGETRFDASRLGAPAPGPLGPSRLVLARPAWGPHVLVVDAASAARATGIAPAAAPR